jgi:hypothetical protein
METVQVTTLGYNRLKDDVAKLNKKAEKYGFPQATLKLLKTEMVVDPEDQSEYKQHTIEVIGNFSIAIAGWQLAAIIDTYSTSKSIVNVVSGFDKPIPAKYRETDVYLCEHCNISRLRKDVYLVYNKSEDRFMQIGSTCLHDYLGHATAEQLAKWAEMIGQWAKIKTTDYMPISYDCRYYDLALYLACVIQSMRESGGYIKRDQGFTPTSQDAMIKMSDVMKNAKRSDWPKQSEFNTAQEIMLWAKSYFSNARSDYELNMQAIFESDQVTAKLFGYAASAVPVFYRNRIKQEETVQSNYVGSIGEKITVKVTVKHTQEIDNNFGSTTTLVKMIDTSGNLFVWFASGEKDLEIGQEITIKGTIKAHQEYNGIKQTILTRCKLV